MTDQIKLWLPLLLMISLQASGLAQKEVSNSSLDRLIERLSKPYLIQDSTLSFDVGYRYTDEIKPAVMLDSLTGRFEINNNRYHSVIGKTETIIRDSQSVTLFTDDKIMYLSKAQSQINPIQNPLLSLSNELKNIKGLQVSIGASKETDSLLFVFPDGMPYKSMHIIADKKTGYLSRVIYIVKTDQLMDPVNGETPDLSTYSAYATITVSFTDYRKSGINEADFDSKKYFAKTGNEIRPSADYKDYKVYAGTPGL